MDTPPLISVVMPVFNCEQYVGEAIESILAQTFTDFEFIIIDNGSTDRTAQILEQYAHQDERIAICMEPQRGVAKALNTGCKLASGKYIARMDADDVAMPERFAAQLEFLETNPEIGIVGTWVQFINSTGGEVFGSWNEKPVDPPLVKWQVFSGCPFFHNAVMMRVGPLRELGYYSTDFHAEDYELWSRLLAVSQGANIPRPLVHYRLHDEQCVSRLAAIMVKDSLAIATRTIASYIGADVDPAAVHSLWHHDDAGPDIVPAAILAETLFRSFVDKEQPSRTQRAFVRNDLADRLFHMAIRRPHKLSSWLVIWKAAKLDPTVLMRKLKARLR